MCSVGLLDIYDHFMSFFALAVRSHFRGGSVLCFGAGEWCTAEGTRYVLCPQITLRSSGVIEMDTYSLLAAWVLCAPKHKTRPSRNGEIMLQQ